MVLRMMADAKRHADKYFLEPPLWNSLLLVLLLLASFAVLIMPCGVVLLCLLFIIVYVLPCAYYYYTYSWPLLWIGFLLVARGGWVATG